MQYGPAVSNPIALLSKLEQAILWNNLAWSSLWLALALIRALWPDILPCEPRT
jgi:hypothetical protein